MRDYIPCHCMFFFLCPLILFTCTSVACRLSTNVQMEVPSLHYVVTPVRRSTRPSLSRYRSAPGLHCVNSLKQLESSVRKSMVFQPNHALDS
jgi:hypothetical protein